MKQIISLIVVFILLVGGYLFVKDLSQPKEFQAPENLTLSNWQEDKFSEIIMQTQASIELKKQDDGNWLVNGFKADPLRMQTFLPTLSEAKIVSKASTNPNNHERFDVADGGIKLMLKFIDGTEENYIVGKSAGGSSLYVRLTDQDDVYVLDGPSLSLFNTQISVWRDHKVTSLTEDDIESVQFTNAFNTYTVAIKDGEWNLDRVGFASLSVLPDKISPWLNKVVKIQAGDFPDQVEIDSKKESQALATITLTKKDQEADQANLEIWKIYPASKEGFYLLIREQDQSGFFVSQSTIDDVFPLYSELRSELVS